MSDNDLISRHQKNVGKLKETHKMRKRIGTKIYDTETSELISKTPFREFYRKKTRDREWFMVLNGKRIVPITEEQAKAHLGEEVVERQREYPEDATIMLRVDIPTHHKIERLARKEKMPIIKFMRKLADSL